MAKNYVFDYCNFLTKKTERGNITARNTEELARLAYPNEIINIVSVSQPNED